jgi:class 3 adenylate cyclase
MERKLAAILAADIANREPLVENALSVLRSHRKVVQRVIGEHRGRLFSAPNDSFVAEFSNAIAAINCAVDFQQEIAECNESRPQDTRPEFRVGVNIGEIVGEYPNLRGEGVDLALQLLTLAEPGGISAARNVYIEVRHNVGVPFEAIGRRRFKDFAEPVSVYRALIGSTATTSRLSKWLHAIHWPNWSEPR